MDEKLNELNSRHEKIADLQNVVENERKMSIQWEEKYRAELGKHRSKEVKIGQISENLVPFLANFPYDSKQCRALLQPVDLVYFGDEKIVFIEIKTGESQLSEKQRRIRDLVKEGKVGFEIHRLSEKYEIKKVI